jgi:predicted AlkP superfamily phosphohydrolase/phosphomutase
MATPAKVLLIGFDAGEKDLILQWADAGVLPTFRHLLSKGLKGTTMSLPGLFIGATWPSFMTGVTPARHGIHSYLQLEPGTYEFYQCHAEQMKREPFWNYLSRAGRKVCVLDIPLSSRSENLNGIQSVEWGSHDPQSGFTTWPPRLAEEIQQHFGMHPVQGSCNAERGPREFAEFRDALMKGIDMKARLTQHFLKQGGWDFFAQVFTEGHCVGHQCWHIHDPNHPRHDLEAVRLVGDPVKDVYVAIDAAIGRILDEIDGGTTVIVLASHGMGHKYGPQFLLDQILLRLNVAAAPAVDKTENAAGKLRTRLDPTLTWCWKQVPPSLRQLLQPARRRLRQWIDEDRMSPPPRIDPVGGKCFPVENNYAHGGIRVNLVGREPNGKVQPGEQLDDFCGDLTRDLMDIVNLDTGKPVVSRVIRTAQFYRGEYIDHLPDLLVEWYDEAPISKIRVGSDKIGEIQGEYRFCRTGDHRPAGLFIAFGPSIQSGCLDRTVSIMDFAPTIAGLLGVDLPDVDGKAILELLPESGSPE